jgi:hypothetical protein
VLEPIEAKFVDSVFSSTDRKDANERRDSDGDDQNGQYGTQQLGRIEPKAMRMFSFNSLNMDNFKMPLN